MFAGGGGRGRLTTAGVIVVARGGMGGTPGRLR